MAVVMRVLLILVALGSAYFADRAVFDGAYFGQIAAEIAAARSLQNPTSSR